MRHLWYLAPLVYLWGITIFHKVCGLSLHFGVWYSFALWLTYIVLGALVTVAATSLALDKRDKP